MNKNQEKWYVEHLGVRCPYCQSDNIEGRFVEVNAGTAQQNVNCLDCEAEWTDSYTLNGVENFVDKIKVVISVRGGVVQGVWANTQNIDVKLYDFDERFDSSDNNGDDIKKAEKERSDKFDADISGKYDITIL